MIARSLVFQGPRSLFVRGIELASPGPGELLCESLVSAVSSGTEGLFWRGLVPPGMQTDPTIPALRGPFSYPVEYGYSLVCRVAAAGSGAEGALIGRRFFAFHPHCSAFISRLEELIPVPEDLSSEDAALFANAETAVNLVQDSAPRLAEEVAVFGLGFIGLFSASLLARFPLGRLVGYDPLASRRTAANAAGIEALDPEASPPTERSFDLALELTGNPRALDTVIPAMRYSGTVIVGSWYGDRRTEVDLGSWFHRGRLRLISSQVSFVAPELSGRWTKERRYLAAWQALRMLRPSRWISHRFPLERAAEAYELMTEDPSSCLQAVFTY